MKKYQESLGDKRGKSHSITAKIFGAIASVTDSGRWEQMNRVQIELLMTFEEDLLLYLSLLYCIYKTGQLIVNSKFGEEKQFRFIRFLYKEGCQDVNVDAMCRH